MIDDSLDLKSLKPIGFLRYIVPSAVSVLRVLLTFFLIFEVINWPRGMFIAAFLGVPVIFILDAVDGALARFLNSQTLTGSFLDIAADRFVEFLFLQHFISTGLVPLWFVVMFYGRIVLTDACRMRAFRMEKVSATGIFLPQPWNSLVLSKLSRSAYAALKGLLFSVLLLAMYRGNKMLSLPESVILISVLAFSLLRGVPILVTYFPLPRRTVQTDVSLQSSVQIKMQASMIRKRKVASWVQLAYDIFLAMTLLVIASH